MIEDGGGGGPITISGSDERWVSLTASSNRRAMPVRGDHGLQRAGAATAASNFAAFGMGSRGQAIGGVQTRSEHLPPRAMLQREKRSFRKQDLAKFICIKPLCIKPLCLKPRSLDNYPSNRMVFARLRLYNREISCAISARCTRLNLYN